MLTVSALPRSKAHLLLGELLEASQRGHQRHATSHATKTPLHPNQTQAVVAIFSSEALVAKGHVGCCCCASFFPHRVLTGVWAQLFPALPDLLLHPLSKRLWSTRICGDLWWRGEYSRISVNQLQWRWAALHDVTSKPSMAAVMMSKACQQSI